MHAGTAVCGCFFYTAKQIKDADADPDADNLVVGFEPMHRDVLYIVRSP